MSTQPASDGTILDLSGRSDGPLEVELTLDQPQTRLRVRLPAGQRGRAEARLPDGRNWAAKHHWSEQDGVVVYEFDEALPAGDVRLVVPRG